MSGRRCSICAVTYPEDGLFSKCPVCATHTVYYSGVDPDPGWQAHIRGHQEAEEQKELIPTVESPVKVRDDRLYIGSWAVYRKLGRRLEPHELVQIGNQVFEILGYLHNDRAYWVRAFSMTLTEDELRRLADGD